MVFFVVVVVVVVVGRNHDYGCQLSIILSLSCPKSCLFFFVANLSWTLRNIFEIPSTSSDFEGDFLINRT